MKRISWGVAIVIVTAIICGIYFFFAPSHSIWAPKCPFHLLTGWDCPACGNQRALHSLLHGNLQAAFAYNPFLIISVPYLLVVVYSSLSRSIVALRIKPIVQHRYVIIGYLILFIAWWIIRNTPLWSPSLNP